jgi:molecular chaperone GrpE
MPRTMSNDEVPATGAGPDDAGLQAENAALRDRLLRALADAENTRRRAERSGEETRRYAVADFAREILAIADNLQRALAAAEEQAGRAERESSLIEGVRATERMLTGMLERFGVRTIDALGAPFDPALHEAIVEVDDPTQPPGTVVQVVEDGYTIHDRLLRPARVVVTKRGPEPPRSSDAPTQPDTSRNGDQQE